MRNEYVSDRRITDASETVGKTIERTVFGEEYAFLLFSDGTFVYVDSYSCGYDGETGINYENTISMDDARRFDLISGDEYRAWKAEYDAYRAAQPPRELPDFADTIKVVLVTSKYQPGTAK